MTKTNLLLSDITNIIDSHLESEEYNLLFVCNKYLAKYICDYVYKEYGIVDEDMELKDSIKEYYVSFYFSNNKVSFYCETAKGYSGEYKLNDIDNEKINFYICVNMDKKTIFDRLINYNENAKFTCVDVIYENIDNPYEYIDEDEVCECDECKYKDKKKYESCDNDCKYMNCDECCNDFCDCENEGCEDCEGCKVEGFDYGELLELFTCRIMDADKDFQLVKEILDEFADIFIPDYEEDEFEEFCEDDECSDCIYNKEEIPDELLEEIKMIEFFADKIENAECDCGACLRNVLYELYCVGKNIGYGDYKYYMKKVIEEVLEE